MERNNLIKLFCIIILIILNGAVYFHGKELSCNKCQLVINQKIGDRNFNQFVNLTDVYNNFLNGTCLIEKTKGEYLVHGLS